MEGADEREYGVKEYVVKLIPVEIVVNVTSEYHKCGTRPPKLTDFLILTILNKQVELVSP